MLPARRRQLRAWSHETGSKTPGGAGTHSMRPVAAERVNVNNTTDAHTHTLHECV